MFRNVPSVVALVEERSAERRSVTEKATTRQAKDPPVTTSRRRRSDRHALLCVCLRSCAAGCYKFRVTEGKATDLDAVCPSSCGDPGVVTGLDQPELARTLVCGTEHHASKEEFPRIVGVRSADRYDEIASEEVFARLSRDGVFAPVRVARRQLPRGRRGDGTRGTYSSRRDRATALRRRRRRPVRCTSVTP